jgi:uncharacterized membrane protein YdjX (TVP38/TMEM64 family)/Fe-S oxidoreductase
MTVSLRTVLDTVAGKCIGCDLCLRECAFIRRYGKPRDLALSYDPADKASLTMPFECSLCGLCTAVCPAEADPAAMMLAMRRETVSRGEGSYPEHESLRAYERRGTSKKYSYYGFPQGCDTVFFPGCSLSGTRSKRVIDVFLRMRKVTPNMGIVLDCCSKPSHDLGRKDHFEFMFGEMRQYLLNHGVRKVLVACPNCYRMFSDHGNGLLVESIYEVLANQEEGTPSANSGVSPSASSRITIHDPCVARFVEPIITSVRQIAASRGLVIDEMSHSGTRTVCCGNGGGVNSVAPDLASKWAKIRQIEADGKMIVTACAGCASALSRLSPTSHILDVFFDPDGTLAGKAAVSRPPMTYWRRLRLKKWFKQNVPVAASRERRFAGLDERKGRGGIKLLMFLVFLVAAVVAVKSTGVSHFLEQQRLSAWLESYGTLAPVIYMLVYAIAPVLFLPGLPITVVGGILFGPVWGVVYTITGSTVGACLAFLVSRYLARGWVEHQLKSPRWRRLDQGVERHGWKVVAFTRLIPLFPFNLLNYAFGLTKIGFIPYGVTTFLCMLPACIAFIVFSSSLLDLIRGRISPSLLVGLVLVVLVSIFPFLYRRYKVRKGEEQPL